MQLDRLLQLIETPAFAFLRNALTMPRAYPYLVRTLYSVLMILPQSSPQFGALQTRLQCAAQLQATLTAPDAPQGPPEGSSPPSRQAVKSRPSTVSGHGTPQRPSNVGMRSGASISAALLLARSPKRAGQRSNMGTRMDSS